MAIWNILRTFGTFYDHLVHFVFVWYIFPVLVSWTNKNLATLAMIRDGRNKLRIQNVNSKQIANSKCTFQHAKKIPFFTLRKFVRRFHWTKLFFFNSRHENDKWLVPKILFLKRRQ
jgi:hypothetical protein